MKPAWLFFLLFLTTFRVSAQSEDSLDAERLAKMVSLSEVVIRTDMNIPKFIDLVKKDTSFYKAFRNLHVLGYSAWNDIRIRDKKGAVKASLQSKTIQHRRGNCRTMDVLEEHTSGDFYEDDSSYHYYTAELYAGLFFTKGQICGESNVVKGIDFNPKGSSGMDKHKQQLKMLFFNPGKKIPGIPFIGDKIDIFDPDRAEKYDFIIDYGDFEGEPCYVFNIRVKPEYEGSKSIVIDSMTTWFSEKTMEVLSRNYDMSYDAGVYDFTVHMEVRMTRVGNLVVPRLLRYIGNWDVIMKRRERGVFTATLFDFTK